MASVGIDQEPLFDKRVNHGLNVADFAAQGRLDLGHRQGRRHARRRMDKAKNPSLLFGKIKRLFRAARFAF